MSYGFIYITTNNITGKKYIGQCSGDPESSAVKRYFGSGKAILRSIKKYGIENFSKEIISYHNTLEELNEAERSLIKEHDAVKSKQFYNIAPGGRASLGFTGKTHSKERNQKLSQLMKSDYFEHSQAKPITIDGITYKSISEATRNTHYTHHQLTTYLRTNIHPDNVVKICPSSTRTKISSARTWVILTEDGKELLLTNLKHWCKTHNLVYELLRETLKRNTFYCGFKLVNKLLS